ncbi:DegT/DnrJ/EryC1/StrS family aminotransferase [Alphaproteobacteria bacterium]|nr:DegT/DnrJ/EryC1/StrS family aminotransferase [Alphaproteobacteria bacterium]
MQPTIKSNNNNSKVSRIPYSKPSITHLELKYATDAAANGWGENCYSYINKFEELFKAHLGVKYAMATSSCTGALHLGMAALNIGPGDEVIIADNNWVASAAPIIHLGAKPIFVDILNDTWCLDPKKVKDAITEKTKAIVAVHLYGNLCNMNELLEIGKLHNLAVIEDSAEALGSVYNGRKAGSMGSFGTFSFHGTKTITTGEGGMFVTNDDQLFSRARTLNNHGRDGRKTKVDFWAEHVGYKFKMSNIQAAIGCGQIERVSELVERKREILQRYKEHLDGFLDAKLNPELENIVNGAWMPTIVFPKKSGVTSGKLKRVLVNNNIDARSFFWPLSSLPMFEEKKNNKNAYDICKRAINLPSYHDITENELLRVVRSIYELEKQS